MSRIYTQAVDQKIETQSKKNKFQFLAVGLAIFSMFFGASNIIFPLQLGAYAKKYNIFAVLGMSFTSLIFPALGLIAMILFDGNYKKFFYRIGRIPGFLIICLIMALIGPFAAIPRCLTLSFGTLKPYLGSTPLILFSVISCVIMFFCTIKKRSLIDILGKILTPLLLFCLVVVILKGFFGSHTLAVATETKGQMFFYGLSTGYLMMDLLAAFFFANIVLTSLNSNEEDKGSDRPVQTMFKASLVSMLLLGGIYFGFSFVAAFNSSTFAHLSPDALLGAVGPEILGQYAGIVMSLAVALACFTTAITLLSVFAQFLYADLFKEKVAYSYCITLTLITTFIFSNLGFSGICKMIQPVLEICYPGLIVLSILNIVYKLYNFKPVKVPVFMVFGVSTILYFL